MVTRRLIPALFLALMISGLFTCWISAKVSKPVSAKSISTRRIVAVTRSIAPGQVLDASSLQMIDWPASQALAGEFDKLSDVSGRVALLPFSAGEIVLAHQLATPGSSSGLMAQIAPGMRAITVQPEEIASGITFLVPGSLVDILATRHTLSGNGMETATVLQSVRVLAVGDSQDPTATAKPGNSPTVTLLLPPASAEKLTLAASLGKIVFVLRNTSDRNDLPELNAQLTNVLEPVPQRSSDSKPAHTLPPVRQVQPDGFTVETIAGSKRTEQTFGGGTQ